MSREESPARTLHPLRPACPMKEVSKDPPPPPFTPFCQRGRPEIPQPAIPQIQALQVRQVRCDVRARCRRSAAPVQLLWCASEMWCARARCHVPFSRSNNGHVLVALQ